MFSHSPQKMQYNLFMGLSLAPIIGAWATIGVKGPDFLTKVLEQQQKALRERYGLPSETELGSEMAEVPPSLRNATTTSDNST
jgi:hypothetical protein